MITVETPEELRATIGAWKADGARVGFVPTMGALHAGHLSLVHLARERADRVVVSIFVNPTQFGPGEDLDTYPRTPEQDAAMLEEAGVDLLFHPTAEMVYPPGSSTWVDVDGPALGLEGEHRPGHFRGVATVVAKLFHLVAPDLAVFGEKDAQQLAVLETMTRDLFFPLEIVRGPTVREDDGLAMSSRNAYLSPDERRQALVLSRALRRAVDAIEAGELDPDAVRQMLADTLAEEPAAQVEYAEVVDERTFQPIPSGTPLAGALVLPMAVRIGTTRLIDNLRAVARA
jgi:pantoate--beta-alanine ligase